MPVGIACPVRGHLTMTIPITLSLEIIFAEKHRPVGVRLLSVRCTWGASRTLSDRASGSGAHARHSAHSYRPDPSSNEACTSSAAFQAGSMKRPGETFPDRLARCRRVPRDFHVAFTHARFSFSAGGIPRDARRRHENSRSVFDRIFG